MFLFSAIRQLSLLALVPVGAVAMLSGCGKTERSATQVVARVDGEEISIHQVNAVLSKMGQVAPDALPNVRQEVVQGLVDQQLAINLAVSKKLDRSPEVVTAIENAKREILARAAMDQMIAGLSKPTEDDAKKYFATHPALFSQRRIFNFQEIALRKNASVDIAEIQSKLGSAKSLGDLTSILKSKNIEFKFNEGTRAAEQLPMEILPKLQELKDGQISLIEGKEGYLIIRMIASQSSPVFEDQAMPRIKQFLYNQSASEAIKTSKLEMRSKAKVEYFGEFGAGGSSGSKNDLGEKAGQKTPTTSDSETGDLPQRENIEKGIKGLK